MKRKQQGYINSDAFGAFMGALIVIGIAIGGVLFVVLPWLWHLIKPWIHSVTG